MRKPNPTIGRQIAFRIRMKKRWQEDRQGMLKRSQAGGRAMMVKARNNRETWAAWLEKKTCFLSKPELLEAISKAMDPMSKSKPHSVFVRLMRCGLISFDIERMEYRNNCFKV
jgi:hypothetical protein